MTTLLQLVLAALLAAQSQAGEMQSQAVASSQGAPAHHGAPLAGDTTLTTPPNGSGSSGGAPESGSIGQPAEAIHGNATWYDAPSIHDAAAGPALREAIGKHWRGTWVEVTALGQPRIGAVRVRLTDWCLCSKGHRVIDLDDRAFRELAPLSRGVVKVVISWGDIPALPATDCKPEGC